MLTAVKRLPRRPFFTIFVPVIATASDSLVVGS